MRQCFHASEIEAAQIRHAPLLRRSCRPTDYASADVFVFPSRTDTFGLVMLEALASGVPVAAYPVPGPLDVLAGSDAGALDEDLQRAALRALSLSRSRCREYALRFSWSACAQQFLDQLCPAR